MNRAGRDPGGVPKFLAQTPIQPGPLITGALTATQADQSLGQPWRLSTSGVVAGNGDFTPSNSPSFDGTGADLIVMVGVAFNGASGWATDSSSNTWQYGTAQIDSVPGAQIAYVHNPTVTSSMTVGMTGDAEEHSPFAYYVFSGSVASGAVFDVENGDGTGATQPGSITPSQNNSLLIAGIGDENSGGDSVDSGFTGLVQIPIVGGVTYGMAAAYLVQVTAAAINPTWTSTGGLASNVIAAFKPAAGASGIVSGSGGVTGTLNVTQANQTLSAAGTVPITTTGRLGSDVYTVLRVHADGTSGSTSFTDTSPLALTLTASNGAQVNTANPKFGTGSADFSSNSNAIITTNSATAFNFGAGPFTIEAWSYLNTSNALIVAAQYPSNGNIGFYFFPSPTSLSFDWTTDGSTKNTTFGNYASQLNTWAHLAIDRDSSNTLRLYLNGQVVQSQTLAATIYPSTGNGTIGNLGVGGNPVSGLLDEIRVTNGLARYGGAFSPPTAPFPDGDGLVEDGNSLSAAGTVGAVGITGTLAVTQAGQTLAAAGNVRVNGILNVNQAPQTIVAAGGDVVAGVLNVTQVNQTLSSVGHVLVSGTLSITQANQTLSAVVLAAALGALNVNQAPNTLVAAGGNVINGTLAALQAPNTLVATGGATVAGTLNTAQVNQTVSATGTVTVAAVLALVQGSQILVATGTIPATAGLSRIQAPQTLVAHGTSGQPGITFARRWVAMKESNRSVAMNSSVRMVGMNLSSREVVQPTDGSPGYQD